MFSFTVTLIFLFLISIIVVRFMGKTALAQFTPHDFTAIFFIIALAMSPIDVENIIEALTGIIVVIVLHVSFSKLSLYNHLNRFVVGEPTILIKHGKLDRANLKKSRFSLAELLSSVRNKGYADITNIQYAILEPNGAISVLPKEKVQPVTSQMLNVEPEYEGFPLAVVIEGEIQYENLSLIHKDRDWLLQAITETGISHLNQVFYASVKDTNRSLIVDDGKGNVRMM